MTKIDPTWIKVCDATQCIELSSFNPRAFPKLHLDNCKETVQNLFDQLPFEFDQTIAVFPCIRLYNNPANGTMFERFGWKWMVYNGYAFPLLLRPSVLIPAHSNGIQALEYIDKYLRNMLALMLNEECGHTEYEP